MAKTNAERQRAYRERRKQKDNTYMQKERDRAKQYRKSAAELTRQQHAKRLEMNRIYCKTYRLKKNIGKLNEEKILHIGSSETQTSYGSPVASTSCTDTNCSDSNKLVVSLPFPERKPSASRQSKARALGKAKLKITELQNRLKVEQRAKKRWQKKCERLSKRSKNPDPKQHTDEKDHKQENATPRTKTKLELRAVGIKPNRSKVSKQLFRKMTLTNCLIEEIKASRKTNTSVRSKKQIKSFASGRIMKKYRCMNILNKETGICRKKLANMSDTTKLLSRTEIMRTTLKAQKVRDEVKLFYNRDDISRCMPGKKDATNVGGQKIQTRILNDYLHNLHEKFESENSNDKISYSMFCKLRPKNVKLTALLSRNTCLCTVHQNMALKLKCLRSHQLDVSPNPEVAARTIPYKDMENKLEELTVDEIEYEEWQRVEVDGKKRMRVVKNYKPLTEFKQKMQNEFRKFLEHCSRVHDQYTALHTLKTKLSPDRAVIQMDFAENFACQSTDEIQSAYWNATSVTIHPVVIYYIQDGTLKHKNFAYISDVNHHNTAAVFAIIGKLMEIVKDMFPSVKKVHYWTDSPSSQYRNRNIFHVVVQHQNMFGLAATWDYFEAGHGKSVCDGIGGACKRMASEAVKQRKVSIQDGSDFYKYAHENEKSISYIFYTQEDYERAAESIAQMNAKVIPGTMKIHAVRCEQGKLLSRTTSCYCDICVTGYCDTWTIHEINEKEDAIENNVKSFVTKGNFVVAVYDKQVYVGEILDTDDSDKTAEINFMKKRVHKGSTQFSWPSRKDMLWVEYKNILMAVEKPVPADRFQRFFTVPNIDLEKIEIP